MGFQSTLPIQGETLDMAILRALQGAFQSTLPIQGETQVPRQMGLYRHISIHSPYTGRDASLNLVIHIRDISIHSPYTGRD